MKNYQYFPNDEGELDLKYENEIKKIELFQRNKVYKYSLILNNRKEFGKPTEDEFIHEFIRFSYVKINRKILRKIRF